MAGSDDKAVSVVQMVQGIVREGEAVNARSEYPKGPLFTFLVGAGFSVTAGMPSTGHLVAALEAFDVGGRRKKWQDVFEETKATRPQVPVHEIGEHYASLMKEVPGGPSGRQAFVTEAVQWAANRQVQMSMESVLLAATLVAGAGRGESTAADGGDRAWLAKAFARQAFTTNFDELLPNTFYLGNQPADVVDGPSPRPISDGYPSVVYLHGRHLHYDLRNTPEELSRADVTSAGSLDPFGHFREALRKTGLIVIGYAGAEDRVMECIEEALQDGNSLLPGLWWCAYPKVEAVDPRVQGLVEASPRAHYLQPGADARTVMEALTDEVRVGRFAAVSRWHKHAERTHKLLKEWLSAQQVEVLDFIARARGLVGQFRGDVAKELLSRREKLQKVARGGGDALLADFLGAAGGLLRTTHNFGPAVAALDESLLLYRKLGDNAGAASCLLELGMAQQGRRRHDKASAALEEALKLFVALGNDVGKANALHFLAGEDTAAGNVDQARARDESALDLCRGLGYQLGEANALQGLGTTELRAGRIGDARAWYEAADRLYRQLNNQAATAAVLAFAGNLELRAGDANAARAILLRALGLFAELGLEAASAGVLTTLAHAQMWMGDLKGARESLQEAQPLNRKVDDQAAVARHDRALGDVYLKAGNVAAARASYKRALRAHQKAGGGLDEAGDLWGLARCAVAEGDPGQAVELLDQAHDAFSHGPDAEGGWWLDAVQGQILALQGDAAGAREVWVKAEGEARTAGFNLVADELRREIEKLDAGEGTEGSQEVAE